MPRLHGRAGRLIDKTVVAAPPPPPPPPGGQPESFAVKEEECHPSYEQFRTTDESYKAMQYWEEMVSMWDAIGDRQGSFFPSTIV